jgi:hypothetical protein
MTKIKKSMEPLLEEAYKAGQQGEFNFQSWLQLKLAEQKSVPKHHEGKGPKPMSGGGGSGGMMKRVTGRGR